MAMKKLLVDRHQSVFTASVGKKSNIGALCHIAIFSKLLLTKSNWRRQFILLWWGMQVASRYFYMSITLGLKWLECIESLFDSKVYTGWFH